MCLVWANTDRIGLFRFLWDCRSWWSFWHFLGQAFCRSWWKRPSWVLRWLWDSSSHLVRCLYS